jgi:hypothetical protein
MESGHSDHIFEFLDLESLVTSKRKPSRVAKLSEEMRTFLEQMLQDDAVIRDMEKMLKDRGYQQGNRHGDLGDYMADLNLGRDQENPFYSIIML